MEGQVPTMSQLRGLSLERAELFGKPHIGARYTHGARYERTGERCCICNRPAANCHHVAPRRLGERFALVTPDRTWLLRSPLFALCGSGTTGCHNGFHGGSALTARWMWDDPQYERWWWDGILLEQWGPHAEELYGFGFWRIEDRKHGRLIEIREGN